MNNELVRVINEKVLTSSLTVAYTFEKEHKNVIRDIRNLLKSGGSELSHDFIESTYEKRGKRIA